MTRMKPLAVLAALLLSLSSCGKDVTIDVDGLPRGNAAGVAATGVYDYNEVISASDCPASIVGVAIPSEGSTWSTTLTVTQEEGYLRWDYARTSERDPCHFWDGGIYWHGNFRIGGTYFFPSGCSGGPVTFINLCDGRYTDGVTDFEGTTTVRVLGSDLTDCELKIEFSGTRRP